MFRCFINFLLSHFLFTLKKRVCTISIIIKSNLCICKTAKPLRSSMFFLLKSDLRAAMYSTVRHYLFCFLWCHSEGPKMASRRSTLKVTQVTSVCLSFRSKNWKRVWGTVDPWKLSRTSRTCITASGWGEKSLKLCINHGRFVGLTPTIARNSYKTASSSFLQ